MIESNSGQRSRLQYDAEWSEARRTKDREINPTTSSTTRAKPRTSTSKPLATVNNKLVKTRESVRTSLATTQAVPVPTPDRYADEVYAIDLPMRRWRKDPLLKCWVLLTVRGKILIAKPGERPKRITKEKYYLRRRKEIIAQRGENDILNEITRSPPNDQIARNTRRPTTKTVTTKVRYFNISEI